MKALTGGLMLLSLIKRYPQGAKTILFLISFLFAVSAQTSFSFFGSLNNGLILYLVSFIFLLTAFIVSKRLPSENTDQEDYLYYIESDTSSLKTTNTLYYKIISYVLFGFVIFKAFTLSDNLITMFIWLLCLAFFVLSLTSFKELRSDIMSGFNKLNKKDWLIIIGIFLLASVLRIYKLDSIPLSINQEEGFAAVGAYDVLNGTLKGPFQFGPKSAWGWTYYSGLYYYGHAVFMKLAGISIFGNRLFAAVCGIFSVIVTMGFGRLFFDKKVAYISGLLVAVFGAHIHFSRFGFPFISNALMGIVTLYLILLSEKKRSPYIFALAGMSIGISQFTWSAARLLPLVALFFYGYKCIQERQYIKKYFFHLVSLLTGFVFSFLPLILPLNEKLPNFMEGSKRDFIFGGFMSEHQEKVLTIYDQILILIDYIKKALLEFNFFKDNGYCYGGPKPMLPFFTSILFAIGLFYIVIKWKKPSSFLFLLAFLGTTCGLVALSTHSPNYQRMVVILCLPPISVAVGIKVILDFIPFNKLKVKLSVVVIIFCLLAYLFAENYNDYFNAFISHSNKNIQESNTIGTYINNMDAPYPVYIPSPPMHIPWVLSFYLKEGRRNIDSSTLEKAVSRANNEPGKKAVFILLYDNKNKIQYLKYNFPNGKLEPMPGNSSINVFTIN
jgi:4-amino-4-deoxy-L-arabinose transferase-like glycosyltransferase